MAPRKNKSKSKPRRKMNRARRGGFKSKVNTGDFASLSCKRTLQESITNQMYSYTDFRLTDFPRAVQVARAYQHFRISGITITWKPRYDTYSDALGIGRAKPNLYYMIDKSGSIPDNVTLEGLKAMGARPRAYDEKPVKVTWRPSVLEVNEATGAITASQYKVSPWLSTNVNVTSPGVWNASQVSHQGIKWYVEQQGGNTNLDLEVELQFQFKKPLFPTLSAVTANKLAYAVEDASPDGIEGGADGITIPLTTSGV